MLVLVCTFYFQLSSIYNSFGWQLENRYSHISCILADSFLNCVTRKINHI